MISAPTKMKQKIAIILENIRSVHNVGSVFRTSDGAGIDKIICCGYTPTPEHKRIHKVALDAEKSIQWEQYDSSKEACQQLKKDGFEIWILETEKNAENIFNIQPPTKNIALVFGHEVDGVTSEMINLADKIIKIPMRGIKQSLNISVAAGIAMYTIAQGMRDKEK